MRNAAHPNPSRKIISKSTVLSYRALLLSAFSPRLPHLTRGIPPAAAAAHRSTNRPTAAPPAARLFQPLHPTLDTVRSVATAAATDGSREPLEPSTQEAAAAAAAAGAVHKERNMALNARVGFCGAGQMAEALARGFLSKGVVTTINVFDINDSRCQLFRDLGCAARDTVQQVVDNSDIIIIAVKPNDVAQVLEPLRGQLSGKTVVSIAAGVTLTQLQRWAGEEAVVVRVMPNTPCLVGQTAAAMSLGHTAGAEVEGAVRALFSAVGSITTVDEKLMAAVTGLSGSGPAYVFLIIEALADGGVRAGLPRPIAHSLAAQTVLGSAAMVVDTHTHPGVLKDAVTSPGGTTITGMHELEKGGVRAALMNAVLAATQRAEEMGKE